MNTTPRVVFVDPNGSDYFPKARLSRPSRCERIDITAEVDAFASVHGHTRVPTAHWQESQVSGLSVPLGLALSRLRHDFKGRKIILSAGGVASRNDQYFIDGIDHVGRFAKKSKASVSEIDYCPEDGFPLGAWISAIKQGMFEVSDERISWADEALNLRHCSSWFQRLLSVDRSGSRIKRRSRAA